MEKIYIGHSSDFDYKKELYNPIRNSKLNSIYKIILPHENSTEPFNSKEDLKYCKLMIAEVSFPSTGLGIELAWANSYNVPILFIHKKGHKISSSLKVVSSDFIEYESSNDLLIKITEYIQRNKK